MSREDVPHGMEDVFVGSLMSSPARTVTSDVSLRDAGHVLLDHDVGSVVVVDDGRLEGILTATDFVRVVSEGGDAEAPVSTVMSRDVVTARAGETIEAAADTMVESGHYHLPVVDDGVVEGVITTHDLTAYVSTVRAPHPPRGD